MVGDLDCGEDVGKPSVKFLTGYVEPLCNGTSFTHEDVR